MGRVEWTAAPQSGQLRLLSRSLLRLVCCHPDPGARSGGPGAVPARASSGRAAPRGSGAPLGRAAAGGLAALDLVERAPSLLRATPASPSRATRGARTLPQAHASDFKGRRTLW